MDDINIAFASLQLLTLPIVLSEFSVALCAMQHKLSYFEFVCFVKLFQNRLAFIRHLIHVMQWYFVLLIKWWTDLFLFGILLVRPNWNRFCSRYVWLSGVNGKCKLSLEQRSMCHCSFFIKITETHLCQIRLVNTFQTKNSTHSLLTNAPSKHSSDSSIYHNNIVGVTRTVFGLLLTAKTKFQYNSWIDIVSAFLCLGTCD